MDLKAFYERIGVTYQVYTSIKEQNEKILKKDVGTTKKIKTFNDTDRKPEIRYILQFLSENHKKIVSAIFDVMEELKFDKVDSVQSRFITEYPLINDEYSRLKKVKLYPHTVNCVLETIEILNTSETPKDVMGICVIISAFHDFGKHPTIKSNYSKSNEYHHKVSARYAKDFLETLQKDNNYLISDEFIETVFTTIDQHHEQGVKYSEFSFLGILKHADFRARRGELKKLKEKEVSNEV